MDRTIRYATLIAAILAVSLASLPPRPALAQFRTTGTPQDATDKVFLAAPHALKQHLTKARKALDQQQYSDAVAELGQLLTETDAEDFFTESATDENLQTSLKAEAWRMLGAMPTKGRDLYQLKFGAAASLMLDDALKTGDMERLADVTRLFFHTDAGYQATILLGRQQLDRGNPLASALTLKRVAESPAALAQFDPELSILLATSLAYADMPKQAEEVLLDLQRRRPGSEVRVAGNTLRLFNNPDKATAWLQEAIGGPQTSQLLEEEQWASYRGNAARNARTDGGAPLQNLRWHVPAPNHPSEQREISDRYREYLQEKMPALPALQPLVVRHPDSENAPGYRDVVLTRTPRRLIAVDFQTGERIWFYPPAYHEPASSDPSSESRIPPGGASPMSMLLQQRTWSDAPYGQISSDSKHVYFVDDLGQATGVNTNSVFVRPNGRLEPNRYNPKPHNQLVALELEREGYLRWMIDGETGFVAGEKEGHEEKLAGAFFLGPPLVRMGMLYVLAEVKQEIQLVALDANTGRRVWSQQLVQVSQRPILQDVNRRLAGASPSFADGVLICPTSAGAIVAVDVSTRSLLWGYQYLQVNPNQRRGVFWQGRYQQPQRQIGNRWNDATATIADGKVLVTPVESDKLFCLNLLDGKLLWEPRERGDLLHVACVHDGRGILVGKQNVVAVSMADGKELWTVGLPQGAMPSGRGFYSDHFLFLPTTGSELLQIDLNTGKLEHRITTRDPLGNLICYKNTVISQGVTTLSSFYQLDALRKLVPAWLKQNPENTEALARQGELLIHDGRRDEAIAVLRDAYRLDKRDEIHKADIKSLLVETLLAALREDFAANQKLSGELEQLIDTPDQRAEFYRLVADGLQKSGQAEQALAAYLKLLDLESVLSRLSGLDADRPSMERVDDLLMVRRDRWMRGRLSQLFAEATPAERANIDKVVEQRLKQAIDGGTAAALRRYVNHFGAHPTADEACVELAGRLIENDELLEAELLLSRLAAMKSPLVAGPATALLAELLIIPKVNRLEEAGNCYRRLATEFASVVCRDGQTGQEIVAAVMNDSVAGQALAGNATWAWGKVDVVDGGKPLPYSSGYQRVYPSDIRQMTGQHPAGLNVQLDRQHRLIVRDGLGRERVRVPLQGPTTARYYTSNYSLSHCRFHGHLMILSLGYEIFSIDTLHTTEPIGDRILWQRNMAPSIAGASTPRMQVQPKLVSNPWGDRRYVGTNAGNPLPSIGPVTDMGVTYQRGRQLICADPINPEITYWSRENIEPGSEVIGDDQILLVIPPEKSQAQVLNAVDGELLGTCEVGTADHRWTTLGRRVLVWETQGNQMRLVMLDPWDVEAGAPRKDPVVWDRELTPGARGWLVQGEAAAVMQPDGAFQLLRLEDGHPIVEQELEPEPSLSSIYVMASEREFLLITNNPITEPVPGMTIQPSPGGYGPLGQHSPMILGRVYAFDRATGESLWPVPAVIEHHGLPLDQPTELPVLTFLRNITSTQSGRARKSSTSVLCIDKRDGRVIFEKDDVVNQTQVYLLEGDPEEASVSLMLPKKTYTLKFTEAPRAPEPPAQLGSASSLTNGNSGFANITSAILGAIGRGTARVQGGIAPIQPPEDPADPFNNAPGGPDPFAPAGGGADPFGDPFAPGR